MMALIPLSEAVVVFIMLRRNLRKSFQIFPRRMLRWLVLLMTVKVESKLLENDFLLVKAKNESERMERLNTLEMILACQAFY